MNFWHLQIHQGSQKRLTLNQFKEILNDLQVIGLGHPWKNKKGDFVLDSKEFQEKMEIDDVVLIRDGKTPIALVKVISNAFEESQANEQLDWFPIRRKIKVLSFFEEHPSAKTILQKILQKGNRKQIQATGTLTKATDFTKVTNQFIKQWWKLCSETKK